MVIRVLLFNDFVNLNLKKAQTTNEIIAMNVPAIIISNGTRESRLADPPWKTQSGPNPLLDQKWTTGGDRGPNFEQKLWTKIS